MEIAIARLAGIVWLAYFGLSTAGAARKMLPLSLAANAVYFAVAVVLFLFLASTDRLIAFALLPLAGAGCVVQSIGMIRNDRSLLRVAFVFFGLFLATVGYLLMSSRLAPPFLGYALMGAGLACITLLVPRAPRPVGAIAFVLAALSEGALALWLLVGN